LDERLNNVLGLGKPKAAPAPTFEDEEYDPAPISSAPARQAEPVVEDDDALSYFARLAAED
jgi:hypothetical protein